MCKDTKLFDLLLLFFIYLLSNFGTMKTTSTPYTKASILYASVVFILHTFSNSTSIFAQTFDSFSDGDFSNNPTWMGDTSLFKVNTLFQLQLNATLSGSAYLALPVPQIDDQIEWKFNLKLPFSPSANNCAQFFLIASSSNLLDPNLEGYYLQFGENLSNDAIELFYKSGSSITSICRGTNGKIANPFDVNVKVKYQQPGLWEIFVDSLKTGDYLLETSGISIHSPSQSGIGIICKYTSSNISNFFIDDIYYGPPIVDTIPPTILQIKPNHNGKEIVIHFSENVQPFSALNKQNYTLNQNQHPDSLYFLNGERDVLKLLFYSPLISGNHHVSIQNIADDAQNVMIHYESNFYLKVIQRNDILITEIMADPTPQILLPPSEYIELYNNTIPDTVLLSGWKLQLGNNKKVLPDIKIPFNKYVIIVPSSNFEEYQLMYDEVYKVSSLGITNDGQQIQLLNESDQVIHCIDFKVSWHSNVLKRGGGWSLEMIDLQNPCIGKENWDSSNSNLGGTPTTINSINGYNPDSQIPEMEKVTILDPFTILLFFNETLSSDKISNSIHIDNGISLNYIELVSPQNNTLKISLERSLQDNVIYTLTIIDSIQDCVGNYIQIGSCLKFGIPKEAAYFDIVINEILTNSYGASNGDFIELYNRSSKIIDLGTLLIGYGDQTQPQKLVPVVSSGYQLFPNNYLAICYNKQLTMEQYSPKEIKKLITNDSLPNFNNSEGVIYLTTKSFQIIDKFGYNESMHSPFLQNFDGVSLEKINFDLETQNNNHWKSAAQSVGFATPGFQNSHFIELNDSLISFEIIPEVFSPNGDGYEDFVVFKPNFSLEDYRITISIFNIQGDLIKIVVNNQIGTPNTLYSWDGSDLHGRLSPTGIYIVKCEMWSLEGKNKIIKKLFSLYRN